MLSEMKGFVTTFLTTFMTFWLMLGLLWSSIPRCGFLASFFSESKHVTLLAQAGSEVHGLSCHQIEDQSRPLGQAYSGQGCRCDLLDFLSTSLPPSFVSYELEIASFDPPVVTWHNIIFKAELSLQPPLPPPRLV